MIGFIDDFIQGMITVSENASSLKGQVVNIGSGVQSSNREVVSLVEKICNKKIEVRNVDELRNFDTTLSWVADSTKLRSLGWSPLENLESGIAKVIYEKRRI